MRRRNEPQRQHESAWRPSRERAWSSDRDQDDRDAYGEYPGQFGGDYDDDERRFGGRGSYGEGERETGGWGSRNMGGQNYGGREHEHRGYGHPEQGFQGQRGMGGREHEHQSYGGGQRSAGQGYRGSQGYGGQSQPSGDRGFRGHGPRGYTRSDERIREEICERLTEEDVDVSDVEVIVTKGEVTLSGTVEERRTKRDVESIAERISGVKDVSNQIRVRSESDRRGESGTTGKSANSIGENDKRPH